MQQVLLMKGPSTLSSSYDSVQQDSGGSDKMIVASEIVRVLQHHNLYSKVGTRKNNVEYHNNGGLQD